MASTKHRRRLKNTKA